MTTPRLTALAGLFAGLVGCNLILGTDEGKDRPGTGGTGGGSPATCSDGARDGDESDKDCGGSCSPCADGKGCDHGPDCESKVCSGGTCIPPKCDDMQQNGDETGLDCGGSCTLKCGAGTGCKVPADCKSGVCTGEVCQPTCTDGEKDGDETGADCGGPTCPACPVDDPCALDRDCQSGVCQGSVCKDDFLWARSFDIGGFNTVAVDATGGVIMTGTFSGMFDFGGGTLTAAGSHDMVVLKLDSGGKYVWAKSFGHMGSNVDNPFALAVDGAGNVYWGGSFDQTLNIGGPTIGSTNNLAAPFLGKLNAFGVPQWSKSFGESNLSLVEAIAVDGAGDVYATGAILAAADFGGGLTSQISPVGIADIFVVRYTSSGTFVWGKRFGSAGTKSQFARTIAVDASGNVVLAGSFKGTMTLGGPTMTSNAASTDVFVAKLSGTGAHVWSKQFGDPGDQAEAKASVDEQGNIVVTGAYNGAIDFGGGSLPSAGQGDIFLAKLDPNGGHVWSKRFGDASIQSAPYAAVDPAGEIALTGTFLGTIDLGGGPLACAGGTTGGNQDVFVAKLDASGNHLWSRRYGDTVGQFSGGIAVDAAGSPVVVGSYGGALDFGGGTLPGKGSFVAKLLTP